MRFRDRLLSVGTSAVAALFLVAALVAPVLAEAGDGDGADGDEIVLPLILRAAVVIGVVAYLRGRRSPSRPS